jgi:hypothetical protein
VDPLDGVYFVLTALFWIGHRVGSVWLAYFTSAYRPLLGSQPIRFVLAPILIAVATFALLMPADDALPFTRAQRVIGLVILDYALVTYHFAAQHFGLLSLYRVRGGTRSAGRLRLLDRLYALGIGGALVILAEVLAGTVFFQDLWVDPWLDPAWVASAQAVLRVVGTALVVVATVGLLAYELFVGRPSLPRTLYLLGIALMVLVALHAKSLFVFVFLWTAQHWITAVGLTTRVARAEPDPGRSWWYRLWHVVNRRPWLLVLTLALLSVLLLPIMEVEALGEGGTFYGDRIFGALAELLRTSTLVPALVALGFTTAFLHYLLDRATYRLSDPEVRTAARGLLEP